MDGTLAPRAASTDGETQPEESVASSGERIPSVSTSRRAKECSEIQSGKATLADVTQVLQLKHVHHSARANKMAEARAAAATAAKERADAVKEVWYLFWTCQWNVLVRMAVRRAKKFSMSFVHHARSEHTVISFLYPHDADDVLYDTQAVQIFFNVLALESVLLAMLFSNSPSTVSPGIITLVINMVITVVPCVAAAMVLRMIFKRGNKGLRRKARRERLASMAKTEGKEFTETLQRWKEERARGLRRAPGALVAYIKFVVAWIIVLLTFIVCILMLMIYAMSFGELKMRDFLLSVVAALGHSFGVVEPLEILLIISLPFLLDNSVFGEIRGLAKDLGLV